MTYIDAAIPRLLVLHYGYHLDLAHLQGQGKVRRLQALDRSGELCKDCRYGSTALRIHLSGTHLEIVHMCFEGLLTGCCSSPVFRDT
jgi:hypothetical protein